MCEFDQRLRKMPGAAGFVDGLVTAIVNSRIYTPTHPRVRATVDDLVRRLEEYFTAENEGVFALGCAHGYVIFDGRPLLAATLSAPRLIQACERLTAGGIELQRGVTAEDLTALLEVLGDRRGAVTDHEAGNQRLASLGAKQARLLPPHGLNEQILGEAPDREALAGGAERARQGMAVDVPVQLYQGVVDMLQTITIDVCRGDHFSLDTARGQIEKVMQRLDADPKSVLNLARYEHYDAFTFGHSIRVSFLAMNFARSLTRDDDLLNRIGTAALLHDVGKARVPFEILQSKSRLSTDERREMERHTLHGGELLLELEDSDPMAVATAFGHHRTADGRGYPRTVPEARQSSITRIVKICDVYEALTAVRPYKPGMAPVRAYRVMLSMQNHFDLPLLRRFIQVNGIYPIGTEVWLSTGHIARVERQTRDALRPVVSLEASPEGQVLAVEDRRVVDLSQVSPEQVTVLQGGGMAQVLPAGV